MNKELLEAVSFIEREKGISKEVLFAAIENSLLTACKNHFGKDNTDYFKVIIDPDTGDYTIYVGKKVVEDDAEADKDSITLSEARKLDANVQVDDMIFEVVESNEFSRIAAQNAKNVILQKIREEERNVVYNQFHAKEHDIVTGNVSHVNPKSITINLGKADAILNETEMVKGEHYRVNQRIKVYVIKVEASSKGPRIVVSRTHKEFVRRLFEEEVNEIKDGTVEIVEIAREPGSRTKMTVFSNNPNVDPVGACVGVNGARVNAIVDELGGEKIDIINWDENPGNLIQNALSPAQTVAVFADPEDKVAKVVVPDDQLSLAIGKEGQNARLAAKLTGYKIDIKSESQAVDAPGFRYSDYDLGDDEEEYYYDENGEYIGGDVEEEPVSGFVPVDSEEE